VGYRATQEMIQAAKEVFKLYISGEIKSMVSAEIEFTKKTGKYLSMTAIRKYAREG
jgi:hypothetical protein